MFPSSLINFLSINNLLYFSASVTGVTTLAFGIRKGWPGLSGKAVSVTLTIEGGLLLDKTFFAFPTIS